MCNLYTVRKSAAEVAAHFGVANPVQSNAGEEVYPGAPGMVIREAEGERVMQSMTWGFPMRFRTMKPDSKPKPVNNIADLSRSIWPKYAHATRLRCLIPLTGFAEAEGPKGSMTRTWFSMRGSPVFAWGGLWHDSPEWGPVYSGAMTDCNEAIRPVHSRMPVLLLANEYDRWLHGSFDEIIGFQTRCFPDELIVTDRTSELWRKSKVPSEGAVLV